jgi:hypothetical protein
MREKLVAYYVLIVDGMERLYDGSDVLRLEPVVGEILKRLDPELADVKIDAWGNWRKTLNAVDSGLGIIAAREACDCRSSTWPPLACWPAVREPHSSWPF